MLFLTSVETVARNCIFCLEFIQQKNANPMHHNTKTTMDCNNKSRHSIILIPITFHTNVTS